MAVAPTQEVKAYRNYIGGEWVDAALGRDVRGLQPILGRRRGNRARREAVRTRSRAIASARESFDSGVWADMDPDERVRIMRSVVDKFTEHEDELAELESLQSGMTMRATATVVIGYCINHWDYFARAGGAADARSRSSPSRSPPTPTTSCCASRWACAPGSSPGTSRW